jgi:hypothetical protein
VTWTDRKNLLAHYLGQEQGGLVVGTNVSAGGLMQL